MDSKRGRITADLRRLISSGQIRPGDYLPTESKLMEEYDVSKNTVRAATAQLVNEGLIERVAGRSGGMRVREKLMLTHFASRAELPDSPYGESDTFFREVEEQGFTPSQTFRLILEEASAELAQMLGVDEGSDVVLRRCVRSVNDRPTSVQASYYPIWLARDVPELLSPKDISIGTTRFLAEHGYAQTAFVDSCVARMPGPEEATDLALKAGTPVLEFVRRGYTAEQAIRVSVHIMAGDSYRVVHALGDATALRRALESE